MAPPERLQQHLQVAAPPANTPWERWGTHPFSGSHASYADVSGSHASYPDVSGSHASYADVSHPEPTPLDEPMPLECEDLVFLHLCLLPFGLPSAL